MIKSRHDFTLIEADILVNKKSIMFKNWFKMDIKIIFLTGYQILIKELILYEIFN